MRKPGFLSSRSSALRFTAFCITIAGLVYILIILAMGEYESGIEMGIFFILAFATIMVSEIVAAIEDATDRKIWWDENNRNQPIQMETQIDYRHKPWNSHDI